MTVVVTGAAGFIGGHLVRLLAARGYDVVGVDRRDAMPSAAQRQIVGELVSPGGAIDDALEEADAVFHLAGAAGVRDRRIGIEGVRHRDNVLAAARVLRRVPDATPVVVTSSSSVYGSALATGRLRAARETDPLRPLSGYARSKVAMEARCRRRLDAGGHVAVARPFTVTGPGQRRDMAFARWLACILSGQPVAVYGELERVRDVTSVADVALGLLRLAECGTPTTVNLGTGHAYTLAEMLAAAVDACGKPARVTLRPAGPEESPATLADTRHCREVLGFVPATSLEAILDDQVRFLASPDMSPELVAGTG